MTREGGLDPILQPWMERNAPAAPDDLLPRVMREVETVSQRTRTWPSFLAVTHVNAVMAAAVAVAILAIAVGAYFFSIGVAPVGTQASPTPEPTAEPTAAPTASAAMVPTTVAELIDADMAAWNAYDAEAVARLHAVNAVLRVAGGSPVWTESYVGINEIKATVTERRGVAFHLTLASPLLEDGSFVASALAWKNLTGSGSGFAIWRVSDLKVIDQWVMLTSTAPSGNAMEAPASVVELLDATIAAWNAGDGELAASYYTTGTDPLTSCDVRLAIGQSDFTEQYVGRDAIAQTVIDRVPMSFQVQRTSGVLQYGNLYLYSGTWTSDNGNGRIMNLFELSADDGKVVHQWGFGEPSA